MGTFVSVAVIESKCQIFFSYNLKSIAPELSLSVSSIISSISSCPGLSPREREKHVFLFIQIIASHQGIGARLPIPLWIWFRLHPDKHHVVSTLMIQ